MPKRADGEGSIRRRSNDLWEGRLRLPDGKRRSIYGITQKEVRDKLRELAQEMERGALAGTNRQTVGQFLERWLDDVVKVNNAYKTHQSYRGQVLRHIAPALGGYRLERLTAQHVQAFVNRQKDSGLSSRTVRYQRDILRIALNQAIAWKLITTNAAVAVRPPRGERADVRALSQDDAQAILDAFEGDRLRLLVRAALMLGLRRGELLGLRWVDLDFDAGVLHVRYQSQFQDGVWRFVEPKSKESRRTVPIPAFLTEELRTHRMVQLQERLQLGPAWRDHDLVFPTEVGTPQHGINVTHRFQRGLRHAQLPHMRFHELRHGTATLLLSLGESLQEISAILGHSQYAITADIYAHVSEQLKQRAADRLNAAFAPSALVGVRVGVQPQ